jgi:hypothetical protein
VFEKLNVCLEEALIRATGLCDEHSLLRHHVILARVIPLTNIAIRACSPNQNALAVSIEQRANSLLELADKLQAEIGRKI